jgi:hypothetical protein
VSEDRIRTLRTRAIPTVEAYAQRLDDVRVACDRVGRDIATLDIVCTGIWGMLDIRNGLDADAMRADVDRLEAMGVDWIAFNLCGDDPNASIETLEWFGREIIAGH